jgi:hypothetical protein
MVLVLAVVVLVVYENIHHKVLLFKIILSQSAAAVRVQLIEIIKVPMVLIRLLARWLLPQKVAVVVQRKVVLEELVALAVVVLVIQVVQQEQQAQVDKEVLAVMEMQQHTSLEVVEEVLLLLEVMALQTLAVLAVLALHHIHLGQLQLELA